MTVPDRMRQFGPMTVACSPGCAPRGGTPIRAPGSTTVPSSSCTPGKMSGSWVTRQTYRHGATGVPAPRLASGRDLPVAALGHSFIASVLTGDELARRAVEDVNQRMADRTGPDEPATVTRNLKRVESAALAAVLLAAALVLIFV